MAIKISDLKKKEEEIEEAPKGRMKSGIENISSAGGDIFSGKDIIGGLGKGVKGIAELLSSPEGLQLIATQQANPYAVASFLKGADIEKGKEDAALAAYQKRKAKGLEDVQKEKERQDLLKLEYAKIGSKGGKEDKKAAEWKKNMQVISAGVVRDTDRALKVLSESPKRATGGGAFLFSRVPGTQAKELQGHIDSIKSNIGLDKLVAIKQSGAGLGQVPQSQLDMLASVLGNLDTTQNQDVIDENLKRAKVIYAATAAGRPITPKEAKSINYKLPASFWGLQETQVATNTNNDPLGIL